MVARSYEECTGVDARTTTALERGATAFLQIEWVDFDSLYGDWKSTLS